jgi:MFS family permease
MTTAGRRRGSRFAALALPNFRLFLIGQLVSSIGTWLHQIAEVWLTLQITDSGFAVGVVVAARFLPVLTLGLWGGAIADRHDKRTVLYATQSVRAVAALALGVLALAGVATVPSIIGLALVGGVANAIDNPVRRAFIGALVDDVRIFNAVALNSTVMATSRVTGPLLAGGLIVAVGVGWCFIVNAVTYSAALVALRAMRLDRRRAAVRREDDSGSVGDGIRYAAGNRAIWMPLVMVGLVSASAWNWETLLALHATRTFGGGAALFTAMFAVLSVGTLVGAMANAGRTDVDERFLTVTAAAVGAAMLAAAVVPGLPLALVLIVACGIGAAMFNTASNALLQRTARGDYHGRVMAIFSAMFMGTKGLGGAIAGGVAGAWGPRVGIAVGGCGCLGAAVTGRMLGTRSHAGGAFEPNTSTTIGGEP